MKVGDLVRYVQNEISVETNMALVVEVVPTHHGDCVDVLWDDGEVWTHDVDEFEVVDEGR